MLSTRTPSALEVLSTPSAVEVLSTECCRGVLSTSGVCAVEVCTAEVCAAVEVCGVIMPEMACASLVHFYSSAARHTSWGARNSKKNPRGQSGCRIQDQ